MGVHFSSEDLEVMENGLNRLKSKNHSAENVGKIAHALQRIRDYRRVFGVR